MMPSLHCEPHSLLIFYSSPTYLHSFPFLFNEKVINMKLTAAAVTLATFAGASASANASTSKASKSSPSEDKFEGAWLDCKESLVYQIGPNPFPSGDTARNRMLGHQQTGNNLVQITKLDVPGAPKYSAVVKASLGCGVVFTNPGDCSNQPDTGYTEFNLYFVATQSFSSKKKDTLNFVGNYADYLDANSNKLPLQQLGDIEISQMTCSAEDDGALACDMDTFFQAFEGPLAGVPTATSHSFLLVKEDNYESKCAEL